MKRLFLRVPRALPDLKVGFIYFLKTLKNQNIHTHVLHHKFSPIKGLRCGQKLAYSYTLVTHPQKYVPLIEYEK